MSATLFYEPAKPKNRPSLDGKIKTLLVDRYDLYNGSKDLTYYDAEYLQGLHDAGVKGADKLIKAIEKYDEVKISLES